jgi:flagellar basal body-associated protein FliL
MNARSVKKCIVILLLIIALAFVAAGVYLYQFFPAHAAHKYNSSIGAIYQVGMNGTTVFLTRQQNVLNIGVYCGGCFFLGSRPIWAINGS